MSQFEFENGDHKISVKDQKNEYRTIENRLLLDALTDNEKNTVLLHYFYGYQIKEVADLYGDKSGFFLPCTTAEVMKVVPTFRLIDSSASSLSFFSVTLQFTIQHSNIKYSPCSQLFYSFRQRLFKNKYISY